MKVISESGREKIDLQSAAHPFPPPPAIHLGTLPLPTPAFLFPITVLFEQLEEAAVSD